MKKTKPQQKIPETGAIFDQLLKINQEAETNPTTLRISVSAKATVKLRPVDRGGKTRVPTTACDHDFATKTVTPYGILVPQSSELFRYFVSSNLTRDGIVDILQNWWQTFRICLDHDLEKTASLRQGRYQDLSNGRQIDHSGYGGSRKFT